MNPIDGTAEDGTLMSYYSIPKLLLERKTIETDTASVTFTLSGLSIPAHITDLRLSYYARTDVDAAAEGLDLQFNGDTTATNYTRQELLSYGGSNTVGTASVDDYVGAIPGNTATANAFSGGTVLIPEYAKDDRHKIRHVIDGAVRVATSSAHTEIHSGRWKNNAAITSILVIPASGGNFVDGSIIELEGIGDVIPTGWSGIVSGVDDPQAVMGVDKEDIEAIMGVASA
jgi:hypothetical protein